MSKSKLVVIMGSKSDLSFATNIGNFMNKECFSPKCIYEVASAHRSPDLLLKKLHSYEESGDDIVYITIAGLSDALSGVVAGFTKYAVISCPPDIQKFGWPKVFSSVMTPRGIPVLFAPKPENASLAAMKILALGNHALYEEIDNYKAKKRNESRISSEDENQRLGVER